MLENLERQFHELNAQLDANSTAIEHVRAQLTMTDLLAVWRYMKMLHYSPDQIHLLALFISSRYQEIQALVNRMHSNHYYTLTELATFDLHDMLSELDAFDTFIADPYNARLWRPFYIPEHGEQTRQMMADIMESVEPVHRAAEARALAAVQPDAHNSNHPNWFGTLNEDLRRTIVRQTLPRSTAWRRWQPSLSST